MFAREHVDLRVEAIACDTPLEGEREEPIVLGRDHADRDLRPALEAAGLAVLLHHVGGDGEEIGLGTSYVLVARSPEES